MGTLNIAIFRQFVLEHCPEIVLCQHRKTWAVGGGEAGGDRGAYSTDTEANVRDKPGIRLAIVPFKC